MAQPDPFDALPKLKTRLINQTDFGGTYDRFYSAELQTDGTLPVTGEKPKKPWGFGAHMTVAQDGSVASMDHMYSTNLQDNAHLQAWCIWHGNMALLEQDRFHMITGGPGSAAKTIPTENHPHRNPGAAGASRFCAARQVQARAKGLAGDARVGHRALRGPVGHVHG